MLTRHGLLLATVLGLALFACSDDSADPSAAPASLPSPSPSPSAAPASTVSPPSEERCTADTDCAGMGTTFCAKPACENGACVVRAAHPAGTPLPSQRVGDCRERQCGADGQIVEVAKDTDVPDPYGNECINKVCIKGELEVTMKQETGLCAKGVCDGSGTCVQCIPGEVSCTILGQICMSGFCAGPLCENGVKDPGEGDVDCGGKCLGCATGRKCSIGAQCASGVCTNGTCAAATCDDGVKNQDETEVDCGGPTCKPCDFEGARCSRDADCASNVCIEAVCHTAVCTDGVKNGDEAGIDCGGSSPYACAP